MVKEDRSQKYISNMLEGASWIEAYPDKFNMANPGARTNKLKTCESVGCIGGFCKVLLAKQGVDMFGLNVEDVLAKAFGLNHQGGRSIAYLTLGVDVPYFWPYGVDFPQITPKIAVTVLREMALFGYDAARDMAHSLLGKETRS